MNNVYIINAHHHYSFSDGRLNKALVDRYEKFFIDKGLMTRTLMIDDGWKVDEELANHQWADAIILQAPVNWMGVPWTFKKYMDEVYTAGLNGALCEGDGRSESNPKENYGNGGRLKGKKYMLSLTFNAPKESFDDPGQFLFQGKGVDDLFFPMHMNFRFFGMSPMPTFVCYDVMKNPDVENDFIRLDSHLNNLFS